MTLFTANVKSKMAFAKKNSQNYLPNFENGICGIIFEKYGQSVPLFVYFRPYLITKQI